MFRLQSSVFTLMQFAAAAHVTPVAEKLRNVNTFWRSDT